VTCIGLSFTASVSCAIDNENKICSFCLILDTPSRQKNGSSYHRRREREKSDTKEDAEVTEERPRVEQASSIAYGRFC